MEKQESLKEKQDLATKLNEALETSKKQRIEINAMKNKCELKQYIADETEKDKKILEQKLNEATVKIKEMQKTSEIFEKLS